MTSKNNRLSARDKAIQERIRRVWLRKKRERGLTQGKAAEAWGVEQSTVSNYLNGYSPFNVETVLRFAVLLDESPLTLAPELMEPYHAVLSTPRNDPDALEVEAGYRTAGHDKRSLIHEVTQLPERESAQVLQLFSTARVTGESVANMVREQQGGYMSEKEAEVLRLFRSLDPGGRDVILTLLKTMTGSTGD